MVLRRLVEIISITVMQSPCLSDPLNLIRPIILVIIPSVVPLIVWQDVRMRVSNRIDLVSKELQRLLLI